MALKPDGGSYLPSAYVPPRTGPAPDGGKYLPRGGQPYIPPPPPGQSGGGGGDARSGNWSNWSGTQTSTGYSTSSGGGGGGGSTYNNPGVSNPGTLMSTTPQAIAERYPAFAYLLEHPEIGPLLTKAAQEGWTTTQLQSNLYATNWWKTTSQSARNWDQLVKLDPETAKRKRQDKNISVTRAVQTLGVQVSAAEIASYTEQALRLGWTDQELTMSMVNLARTNPARILAEGTISQFRNDAEALGRQYLTDLTDAQRDDFAFKLAGGMNSIEGMHGWLIQNARQRFVNNADILKALDEGMTVAQAVTPLVNTVASELEMNPEQINLLDSRWGGIVDYYDPENKLHRTMTQTEARKFARTQNEWEGTNNFGESASEIADAITRKFGARA